MLDFCTKFEKYSSVFEIMLEKKEEFQISDDLIKVLEEYKNLKANRDEILKSYF